MAWPKSLMWIPVGANVMKLEEQAKHKRAEHEGN